jgi:hypothetical protein
VCYKIKSATYETTDFTIADLKDGVIGCRFPLPPLRRGLALLNEEEKITIK